MKVAKLRVAHHEHGVSKNELNAILTNQLKTTLDEGGAIPRLLSGGD